VETIPRTRRVQKEFPEIRSAITPENAANVMYSWVEAVSNKPFETRVLFDRFGLDFKGAPSNAILYPLYLQPNVIPNNRGAVSSTIALGLKKSDYDPKLDVEKQWQYLEPPEIMVREGFNAYQNIAQRGDVSMFWKIHAVMPKDGTPFLCANPVQYTRFWPQEQEYVEMDIKRRLQELDPKRLEQLPPEERPHQPFRIRNHLKWALQQIQENQRAAICMYPHRDRLAVAMTCHAAHAWGVDAITFPSEETLRTRWPDVEDSIVANYRRLAEYAKSGKTGLKIYQFAPDLTLSSP